MQSCACVRFPACMGQTRTTRLHRRTTASVTDERFLVASGPAVAPFNSMGRTFKSSRHAAAAIAVAFALSACSHASPIAQQSSPPAQPTTSTTTALPARTTTTTGAAPATSTSGGDVATNAALTAAVRTFWDTYLEVGRRIATLDPTALRERLATRATGEELRQLVAFFTTNKNSGFVVRGDIDVAPKVIAASSTGWQVRDCFDDRTGLYRSDGSRVDTDNPLRHQVLLSLVSEGVVWKVASMIDEGYGCTP